ncbi:MAG: Na+/H+ antiporter NhaA [Gammaproteobacteria bacterium]
MRIRILRRFLALESSSGIILFLMAILAMIWANSPLGYLHTQFVASSLFWINEGLMAIFFLVVGMELKRGFLEGQFSKFSQIALPAIGALGGMIVPALIYVAFNTPDLEKLAGWSTPVATDIAFALGVLSLFGKRVPVGLKLFLLALAIFDDLGAILIIAVFYSHGVSIGWLFQAAVLMIMLFSFNRLSVSSLIPYLVVGVGLWWCLLHSGVHPTIAGVLLAFTIPNESKHGPSPLHRLENQLHPWAAYLIMPVFALANAGISLQGITLETLRDSVVLGIVFGLFLGKQLGVFAGAWLLIKLKWVRLPDKTDWLMLYGVSILCGIGFTMSLFLGTLSFENESRYFAEVRIGVMLGSILSGLIGALVLKIAFAQQAKRKEIHR